MSERLGIVPQDQLFKKNIALDDRSKYLRVSWGDIVYNPYLLWNRAVGVCFDKRGGCVSPAYVVLRPRARGIEKFLHYFLRSQTFTASIDAIASGSVTRRRTAPVNDILQLEFDLASVSDQMAANVLLSELDEKIELNRQMNETLEAIAQTLFKSWFVDFDPAHDKAEGRDPRLPKRLVGLFPDSFEGETPRGWKVDQIGKIAMLNRKGINPGDFPNELFHHFSIPAYDEGCTPKNVSGKEIKSNKFLVPDNSVLLSKLNPRIPRVWLPVLQGKSRAICSTEFLVITPTADATKEFLYCLFSSEDFISKFESLVTGTSGSHQRVKPESLLLMDAVMPGKEIIYRFTEIVQPLLNRVSIMRDESRTLTFLRTALLPKLISGDIKVKE